jgi:hypothetical protein
MQGEFSSMRKRMRLTGKDRREDRKGERKERREEGQEKRELGSPREAVLLLAPVQCTSFLGREGEGMQEGRLVQKSCAGLDLSESCRIRISKTCLS